MKKGETEHRDQIKRGCQERKVLVREFKISLPTIIAGKRRGKRKKSRTTWKRPITRRNCAQKCLKKRWANLGRGKGKDSDKSITDPKESWLYGADAEVGGAKKTAFNCITNIISKSNSHSQKGRKKKPERIIEKDPKIPNTRGAGVFWEKDLIP